MWLSRLHLFVVSYFIISVIGDVGDTCKPTQNISDGKCLLVTECDAAISYLKRKVRPPFERCGFQGSIEVLCCPIQSSTNPRQTTTQFPIDRSGTKDSQRISDRQCKKIVDSTIPPLDLHIIGGVDAAQGEFPHMVALAYNSTDGYDFKCGGSLISDNFILTAAHCIQNLERVTPVAARMGVVELGRNVYNPETDIEIAEIIPHPDFNILHKYHDMALLRLAKSVDYSATLNPACLYTGSAVPKMPLTVTGWGRVDTERDVRSQVLQKANVTMVERSECNESYMNWRKLPNGIRVGQFCAGDMQARTDACQGDSGGPIQAITTRDGHYRVIGITSFGRGCGSSTPGVYTEVSAYLDWIESVAWPNGV